MADASSTWPRTVGLIGAGAMGRAFAAGLARADAPPEFVVTDAIPAAALEGAAELGGRMGDMADVAACDAVVLAVKPKDVSAALEALSRSGGEPVVISVAAGWDLGRLRGALANAPLVRTMPNLAVRHGAGLVAVATDGLPGDRRDGLFSLLAPLGTVEEIDERLFDAATALAGSGPGFVALVAEAMEEGGVRAGLARPQARAMTHAVIAGVASLLDGREDPAQLRQRVSSPAGTTVAGIAALERGAVRAHVADAVVAAADRAREL